MKRPILTALAAATISAASLPAAAVIPTNLLGEAPQPGMTVMRTVTLNPDTRWVAVTQGEVIKFVANGKEFAWVFDGVPPNFELNQVAPEGTLDHNVRVVVQPEDSGD